MHSHSWHYWQLAALRLHRPQALKQLSPPTLSVVTVVGVLFVGVFSVDLLTETTAGTPSLMATANRSIGAPTIRHLAMQETSLETLGYPDRLADFLSECSTKTNTGTWLRLR
jgi:hypothetical protein